MFKDGKGTMQLIARPWHFCILSGRICLRSLGSMTSFGTSADSCVSLVYFLLRSFWVNSNQNDLKGGFCKDIQLPFSFDPKRFLPTPKSNTLDLPPMLGLPPPSGGGFVFSPPALRLCLLTLLAVFIGRLRLELLAKVAKHRFASRGLKKRATEHISD